MSGAKEAREKGLQVREKYGGQWGWSGVTMVEGDEARGQRPGHGKDGGGDASSRPWGQLF